MVGEFEYLLLTAAARLNEQAYGAAIRRLLAEVGRPVSIGALYTTIDRLEQKGLVTTWMGEATAERGGRAKRMVKVTAAGLREAEEFYSTITTISRDVSWAKR